MKSFSEAELWHIKFFLLLPIAIGISLQVLVRARWYFKTTFTFALRAFRCNQGYGSFAWRNKVALHSVYLLKQLIMKVILDIKDENASFFLELVNKLDFVEVLKLINNRYKEKAVQEILMAFEDVAKYEKGKKKLKSAKKLLNEI